MKTHSQHTDVPACTVLKLHMVAREKDQTVEVLPRLRFTRYTTYGHVNGKFVCEIYASLDAAVGHFITLLGRNYTAYGVDRVDYYLNANDRLTPILHNDWAELSEPSEFDYA